jgi:hypothetical protein
MSTRRRGADFRTPNTTSPTTCAAPSLVYEAGVDLPAIQQNLGHADVETTLRYIGPLDADRRRAPAVYTFDLGKLADAPVQPGYPADRNSRPRVD